MKRITLATLMLLLLAASAPAYAHVQKVRDPDDVNGRLDIKKISLEHDFDYVFTIKMQSGWGPKAIKAGRGGINVYVDSAGDERFNYLLVIAKDKKKNISCLVYNRKGDLKSKADAKKTSGTTVNCEVRPGTFRRDRKNFKWAVQTSWRLSKDSYTFDYAPNEGFVRHKIPL
jgi:hypothetical protein